MLISKSFFSTIICIRINRNVFFFFLSDCAIQLPKEFHKRTLLLWDNHYKSYKSASGKIHTGSSLNHNKCNDINKYNR